MLYFEDFMEAIENLPGELNESLTTVRQLDFLTQSILEPLAEANRTYFEDCKCSRLSDYQQNVRCSEIVHEYEKALSNCREKRQIVEKIYNTYEKMVRKLDTELEKFRLELEADNSGITEQIEQRISTMLGKPQNSTMKPERRRQRFRYQSTSHFKNPFLMRRKIIGQACRTALKSSTVRQVLPHKTENSLIGRPVSRPGAQKSFRMKFPGPHRVTKAATVSVFTENALHGQKSEDVGFARRARHLDYSHDASFLNTGNGVEPKPNLLSTNSKPFLGDEEEASGFTNDISSFAAKHSPLFNLPAHSEFGSATLEKGGLSASTVRSQRLGSTGAPSDVSDSPSTISRSNSGALTDHRLVGAPSPVGWHGVSGNRDRRSRVARRPGRDVLMDDVSDALQSSDSLGFDEPHSNTPSIATDSFFEPTSFGFVSDVKLDNPEDGLEDDEDQKRYCVCNDVSYGDMIACDNPSCPFEWFHYSCVSLTVAPKGDWYCPSCIKTVSGSTKSMKKRIGRR